MGRSPPCPKADQGREGKYRLPVTKVNLVWQRDLFSRVYVLFSYVVFYFLPCYNIQFVMCVRCFAHYFQVVCLCNLRSFHYERLRYIEISENYLLVTIVNVI